MSQDNEKHRICLNLQPRPLNDSPYSPKTLFTVKPSRMSPSKKSSTFWPMVCCSTAYGELLRKSWKTCHTRIQGHTNGHGICGSIRAIGHDRDVLCQAETAHGSTSISAPSPTAKIVFSGVKSPSGDLCSNTVFVWLIVGAT